MKPPRWVRRLLRPLIPDRLMARYRLAEYSRQVRANVDVFLPRGASRRRWLAATPDTYRVRAMPPGPPPAPPTDLVVLPGGGDDARLAAQLAATPGIDIGVVGEVAPPRPFGWRRTEPQVAPRAIAMGAEHHAEVGGTPAGPHPLPGLLARARDAGLVVGLAPRSPAGAPVTRSDPIPEPTVVILALVPTHDVGGGSRSAQLAIEFANRGCHVTYVAHYGTAESSDLGLRFVHPRLEQVRLAELDPGALAARLTHPDRLAIVEAPAPPLVDAAARLAELGYAVVYDLMDDWTAPDLAGDWYDPAAEDRLVAAADALVATVPDLAVRLSRPGRSVALVPNAVNAAVFGGEPGPVPADFPPGDGPVLGYHGSLYGGWMDWAALGALAAAMPEARIVVIGDDKAARPELPANVHFLGFKPQGELPAYLARLDAGILPWEVSPLTHAVSPLKAYEYLASGVPLAAPPLRALDGLDGAYCHASLTEAVRIALAAPRPDRRQALAAHSWATRVEAILATVGRELPPPTPPAVSVVQRPVRHYSRAERSA